MDEKRTNHHSTRAVVVAKASVGGEAAYHACELAGTHEGILIAAAVLLVCVVLKMLFHVE